ncbi:MAG: DUF4864 domain-containing protein [Paracoccaceae bacterium]|nr:DUF4864 domain-containing protein [Paracoccaceae bacterium]MDE3240539.1 DUF4864 domain-containing protein [Paracoccaceae bacterium]
MLRTLTLVLCLAAGAGPAFGLTQQEAGIRAVIDDQIAALKADDFSKAFTYASPMIQHLFGNAANFGEMVQRGYPMVWRPATVRYLGVHDEAGGPHQRVMVTDAQGRLWVLDYRMVQVDGAWRIDGVQILPATGAGV